MLIAGVDFESTGLDTANDHVIEIGAVLWDTEMRMPLRMMSELVLPPAGVTLTPEIVEITGITEKMLADHGVDVELAFHDLNEFFASADAVVAHNGTGFDKPLYESTFHRNYLIDQVHRTWIDTCIDVPYPARVTTRKLTHLAAEHGFLNPFSHRAVFDVLTMLRILDQYPIDQVLESAKQPTFRVQALVSYEDREKAKARGYRWDAPTKQWRKHLKAHLLEQEQRDMEAAGMGLRVLEGADI